MQPLAVVGVSHIIITVLQAKYGQIWIDTLNTDLQPTGVLQDWMKRKRGGKKHFACDLAPNTHCDNKLHLSISVLHRSLRCKYSGRLRRWRPTCPLIRKKGRRPSGEHAEPGQPAARKMNTLFTSGSSYYNSVSLAAVVFIIPYSTESCQKVIMAPCDIKICWYTTALFKNTGWDQHVKLRRLAFQLHPSASFVGRCTWRTFQNRSYLARWEKCVPELT